MAFNEYAYALQFRDLITRMVSAEVERMRPRIQYATVKTIDSANYKCVVNYPGDLTDVSINMGTIQPTAAGQIVRIEGMSGDRYITDVVGANTTPIIDTGVRTYVFAGGSTLTHTITFTEPFTVIPVVIPSLNTGYDEVVASISTAPSITSVGIRVHSTDGTAISGNIYCHWIAIQKV